MIYDCFQFFNEMDILEIRLEELYPVVDKFIISESTRTFSGKPKELRFIKHKDRYQKYLDKIKYIVYDDFSTYNNPWQYSDNWRLECEQRRHHITALNLNTLNDNDIIMISDLDEIPKRSLVQDLTKDFYRNREKYENPITICSQLYYGKITNKVVFPEEFYNWRGTVFINGKILKQTPDFHYFRHFKDAFPNIKSNGSWHFSYAGTPEQIIYKIESYAHTENDLTEIKAKVKENVENCNDVLNRSDYKLEKVQIDESYPEAIKNNPEKYKDII